MNRRRIATALIAVALVGAGILAGALFWRGEPAIAQVAYRFSCASSRQYLVEFRILDGEGSRFYGLFGPALTEQGVALAVDGKSLGELPAYGPAIRWFECEGNHVAKVSIRRAEGAVVPNEEHRVEFAVSRPSLFRLTYSSASDKYPSTSCISDTCSRNVYLELSPFEPDDPTVRVLPTQP